MDAIIKGLMDVNMTRRIMVISGLGGSGKTQLTLKFARDFQGRCDHIQAFEYASNTISAISIFSL